MRVDVLGPVAVGDLPLGGPRQRAVLTVLALAGADGVSVDALADAVWAGEPPRTAEHTLHNYVLRLRRLGLEIAREGAAYRLVTPTDVDALESLLGADPRAALALVRGHPGEGLDDHDVVRARRASLVEVVEGLREDVAAVEVDAVTDAREAGALVPALRRLVADSPFRERRWELLMLALYRAGRQQETLQAFAHARRLLDQELGIEPGPSLRRLEQAVLAQDPALLAGTAPAAGGGRALPGLTTRLVGRDAEQDVLLHTLGASRLVTLLGPLGAGKTRLALQEASRTAGDVWFVALEGVPEATAVAEPVLAVVAPSSRSADARVGLISALGRSEGLLVLDAAEQRVADVGALVAELLERCPQLRILVTSRRSLRVPGEATVPLGELTPGDRRALLVDRARLADPGFALAPEEEPVADRLCALVDGLPLGIELVARHLRLLGIGELADRVDADLERWTGGRSGEGLIGAIAGSVDASGPDERALLGVLSVLSAEADLELLQDVADLDPGVVFDALVDLVDRSLVQVRGGPTGVRYAVLLSVRRHCLDGLEPSRRDQLEHRATAVVLRRAARLAHGLSHGGREPALEALDADAPHLRVAFADCLDGSRAVEALRVATALGDYWLARRPAEGMGWLQRLLPVAKVSRVERAQALLQMGHLSYWLNDFHLGVRLLTEARELVEPDGPSLLLGQVLRRLGAIASASDDVRRAHDLLQASAQTLALVGDAREEAMSLLHLGSLLADEGRAAEALPMLVRAREALQAGGDPLQEGHVLAALTLAWWKAGDLVAAQGAGEAALARFQQLGHRTSEGIVAYRLASVWRGLGQPGRALAAAQIALDAGRETGTRTTVSHAHLHLARLALDEARLDEAAGDLITALEVLVVAEDRWVLVEVLEAVARLQLLRGLPAAGLLTASAALREEISQPPAPPDALELAGLVARSQSGPQEPVLALDPAAARARALDLCRALGVPADTESVSG